MASINLFISCVSKEFAAYREALRRDFTRYNLAAKIQEDFTAYGGATLGNLDEWIRSCEAVIHFCGYMTGDMANPLSLQYIKNNYPDIGSKIPSLQAVMDGKVELSYTQWEAWLTAYHQKKLFVVTPAPAAVRDSRYIIDPAQIEHQKQHLKWLREEGYFNEISFTTEDELVKHLYRSSLGDLIRGVSKLNISNLPYQTIGSNFKGREDDLKELAALFAAAPGRAKGVALHGLGGMGKTRLAVEYALSREDEYTALLFVYAAEAEQLHTNIAALAAPEILDLPEQVAADEKVKYAAVIHWLNEHNGWLLILDNADNKEVATKAEELFADVQHGHILITARYDTWSPQIKKKELQLISRDAAVDFLLDATAGGREETTEDKKVAGQIADDLGCLALALEQARAYIVTKELSFAAYRKRWEVSKTEVMEWFDKQQMQYPASVAITWQTSFDQLNSAATTLLNRLAWMAPDPIPKTLLEVEVPDAEPIDAEAARLELKKYSLATSAADKKTFTVHRLVQDITRGRMEKEQALQTLTEALSWMDNAFIGEPEDVRNWPVLEPLVPHVLSLLDHARTNDADKGFTRLMNRVALIFFTKAQYAVAEPLYRRALELDEQNLGPDLPKVAIRLINLASLLQATNRLAEAEPLLRRALDIQEQNFGPDHPGVAKNLNNLAQLLQDTNRLAEAEPLMRRALAIDEQSVGPDHPDVARDLNNLAQLLLATNRLAEAEPLMRRALAIDEQSYGSDHPDVAIDLSNLAQLLKAANRLAEAEPLMRRALAIHEQSFGPDHPMVATDLSNLGSLLMTTNRQAEAEPLMRRALEIDEQSFGPDHPKVAIRLNNLAQLLKSTNRLAGAESLMKRSIFIFLKSYGIDHPNTQIASDNYVGLLKVMGKTEEEVNTILQEIARGENY